jgi:glycine cleavage system H protein
MPDANLITVEDLIRGQAGELSLQVQNCIFPDDVLLDVQNDVWIRVQPGGIGRVGVTSVLSFLAGRFERLNFKTKTAQVARGQLVATVESPRHFAAVRAPVRGAIHKFNDLARQDPKLINLSPYGEGWIVELEQINMADCGELAPASEAALELGERIKELKVRCFKKLPDEELYSIGLECSATLANLDDVLSRRPVGTVIHLVTDDPLAEIEMIRWADQRDQTLVESRREDNLYHFLVEKKRD